MIYSAIVQEDPETGEAIIELPKEILESMGFIEGDEIVWEINDDGSIIIKKKGLV